MKLRFLVSCLALALMTIAARAQVGLYVNPIGIHISNSKADTGPFAFLGDNVTSRTFYGANIGSYYTLFRGSKLDAGLDLRDSIVKGNNASLNSFLIGARVSAKPINAFKPYAALLGGVATSRAPTNPAHVSKVQYGIFGWLDYGFSSHVDFRVVEVGYGSATTANSGNFGVAFNQPSSHLFSVSTGLVFHFNAPIPGAK
jgi:hypothetical protein